MRIVVIGAGRLASCLVPALQAGGAQVLQVWSLHEASARALASGLGCEAVCGTTHVRRDADMYLICVRDNAIADVARMLLPLPEEAVVAHTSGSTPIDVLTASGCRHAAVVYPMQTFTKGRDIDFSRVHFFIEATTDHARQKAEALALCVTHPDNIHPLASAERQQLHLAAVFVSNFVNHCCTIADRLLQPTGLDFSVMQPLLAETADKLLTLTPTEAQTGPALRWDTDVIERHRQLLLPYPNILDIYNKMSESIHSTT